MEMCWDEVSSVLKTVRSRSIMELSCMGSLVRSIVTSRNDGWSVGRTWTVGEGGRSGRKGRLPGDGRSGLEGGGRGGTEVVVPVFGETAEVALVSG